jgi:hypothetical protein
MACSAIESGQFMTMLSGLWKRLALLVLAGIKTGLQQVGNR